MKTPASRDARGARCNKHDNKQGYHRDTKAVMTLDNAEHTTPATHGYLCRPTPGSATAAQSSPSGAASLTSSS